MREDDGSSSRHFDCSARFEAVADIGERDVTLESDVLAGTRQAIRREKVNHEIDRCGQFCRGERNRGSDDHR